MKIAFIYPAHESIGIEYISAVLKRHHYETCLILDPMIFNDNYFNFKRLSRLFSYRDIILRQIDAENPDIIMVGSASDTYYWACDIVQAIKTTGRQTPIVFGGVHVTAVPMQVLSQQFVDYVIIGEGEYATLELAEALDKKKDFKNILNLGYKEADGKLIINPCRTLIQNLDEIPFPDKDLFYRLNPYRIHDYGIVTSRGCPYSCTFCHNSADKRLAWNRQGKYFRQRSVDNVIMELNEAKKKYNFKHVSFWDETFTFDKDWLADFCEKYKKQIGMPFWINTHPNHVSEPVARMLKDAGCYKIEIGVQTLNVDVNRDVLSRCETIETIKKAIDILHLEGLRIKIDVILGLPKMVMNDYADLIRFFRNYKNLSIHTFWLRYYPSTIIIDYAIENGVLRQEDVDEIEQGIPNTSILMGGSIKNHLIEKYQALMTILPVLPNRLCDWILEKDHIKYIPKLVYLNRIILFLLNIKYPDEIGRRYIGRTKYFMAKKLRLCISKKY